MSEMVAFDEVPEKMFKGKPIGHWSMAYAFQFNSVHRSRIMMMGISQLY